MQDDVPAVAGGHASFYITGGTLPRDARSYVCRKADEDLYDSLKRREFCYVLTSRQMGKSSLMVRTAARLRREDIATVILDLTGVGQNLSVEQWYGGLLARIGRQLHMEEALESFWEQQARLGPLQRWMAAIRDVVIGQCGKDVVIFIDEIDVVRSLPFCTDELFAAIRECHNVRAQDPVLRRLTFCLLGVATPAELIQDVRTTPFNIGRRIELTDFTEAEAAPLASGLTSRVESRESRRKRGLQAPARPECDGLVGAGQAPPAQPGDGGRADAVGPEVESESEGLPPLSPTNASSLLSRVLYWTGGHPYLTQRLCQAIADHLPPPAEDEPAPRCSPHPSLMPADVDRLCRDLFLSSRALQVDDNLAFVRQRLLNGESDLAGVLDLYAQVVRGRRRLRDDEIHPLVSILRLSGILGVSRGRLCVRNRIYGRVFDLRWVRANMPDAEMQRQRTAYRTGLLRATMAAMVVVTVVGAFALKARNSEQLAKDRERERRGYVYVAQVNLAQKVRASGNVEQAVALIDAQQPAPGEEDLRGFEWRYLRHLCEDNLVHLLRGHIGAVESVAFSPDGKTLVFSGRADPRRRICRRDGEAVVRRIAKAHPDGSMPSEHRRIRVCRERPHACHQPVGRIGQTMARRRQTHGRHPPGA